MKVLVTGATGTTGSLVATKLRNCGVEVCALVRNPEQADTLKDAGVTIIRGHFEQSDALRESLKNVGAVFLLTGLDEDAHVHAQNVLIAAKEAGSPRIVRQSAWHCDSGSSRILKLHHETEKALADSGMPHTILRPNYFMHNVLENAEAVRGEGVIYSRLQKNLSMIDVRDIADVAVKVLTSEDDHHDGKTYELTGAEAVNYNDVAVALGSALGRDVKCEEVAIDTALETMRGWGLSQWSLEATAELYDDFNNGWAEEVTDVVKQILGREARSIHTFAEDFKSIFS